MTLKITDPNGLILKTAGKYCLEDITITVDQALLGGSSDYALTPSLFGHKLIFLTNYKIVQNDFGETLQLI